MRLQTRLAVAVLISISLAAPGAFSVPGDTASAASVLDSAFRSMYNLDFVQADRELRAFQARFPDDPMGPVSESASTLFDIFARHEVLQYELFRTDDQFTRRRRVSPDSDSVRRFEGGLARAESLAHARLRTDAADANALFALTLSNGLRADYAALIQHHEFKALRYSKRASEAAERLLKADPHYYDAYLATGIQKYLVGLRSAPVRWFLRLGGIKGDAEEGLDELTRTAEKGRLLAPFARIIIAGAQLRKGNRDEALVMLTDLQKEFPANPLFSKEAARLREAETGGSR